VDTQFRVSGEHFLTGLTGFAGLFAFLTGEGKERSDFGFDAEQCAAFCCLPDVPQRRLTLNSPNGLLEPDLRGD